MRYLLMLVLAGCVSTQYTPIVTVTLPPEYGGLTMCDEAGNPVVLINSNIREAQRLRLVRVHELEHVRQVRNFTDGCWAFMSKYGTDVEFRMRTEAEAMCAEYNFAIAEQMETGSSMMRIRNILRSVAEQNGLSFTQAELNRMIPCRSPP